MMTTSDIVFLQRAGIAATPRRTTFEDRRFGALVGLLVMVACITAWWLVIAMVAG